MIFEKPDVVISLNWRADNQEVFLADELAVVPGSDQVLLALRSGKKVLYNIESCHKLDSPTTTGEFKSYKFEGKYWFRCLLSVKGVVK